VGGLSDALALDAPFAACVSFQLCGVLGPAAVGCDVTIEELRTDLAGLFEIEPSELPDDATVETLASWDSVVALQVISYLEGRVDGTIEAEEVERLTSFQAIVDFARSRGLLDG
jgi:acyl carrier protein